VPNRERQAWNQDESSIKAPSKIGGMINGCLRRSQALISIQNRDGPGRKSIKILVLANRDSCLFLSSSPVLSIHSWMCIPGIATGFYMFIAYTHIANQSIE
jgi:hypothetical protein